MITVSTCDVCGTQFVCKDGQTSAICVNCKYENSVDTDWQKSQRQERIKAMAARIYEQAMAQSIVNYIDSINIRDAAINAAELWYDEEDV